MQHITISKAARILGVNKVTLIRWDNSGKLSAKRESVSENRYYSLELIEALANYRFHLKNLKQIRENVNKHLVTRPLDPFAPFEPHNLEEMKRAFSDLREWKRKYKMLRRKYLKEKEKYDS